MDRKTYTYSRSGLVLSLGLMSFNSWTAAAPIKPASIESNGGLAATAQLPGAAAGAVVNGNASGYAEITFNNLLVTGSGQTRYTAAGATLTNNNPPNSAFATPTRGVVNGFGETKQKIAPSSLVGLDNVYDQQGNPIATGRGNWVATPGQASTLSAEANVNRKYVGYAAGYASDPYTVASGSYAINPVLDGSLLLSTNPADPNSNASLLFSAQSTGLGAANNTLWTLSLSLTGGNAPVVSFTSASILGLNDQTVEQNLLAALDTTRNGLVVFDSQYQTTGYDLFSTTLFSSSAFEFGDLFEASATSNVQDPNALAPAPEPSSCVLSGLGLILLARLRWPKAGDRGKET